MQSVFLLLLCKYNAFGQVTDTKITKTKQNYVRELSFFAGPAVGSTRNENIRNDNQALRQWAFSPEFGVLYVVPAGQHIAYSAGIEYGQYNSLTLYRGYFRGTEEKRDNRSILHFPLVEANYTRRVRFSTLDFPVSMRARIQVAHGLIAFVEAGVKLSAVLAASQRLDGYYSTKGLYYASNRPEGPFMLIEDSLLGFGRVEYDKQKVNYIAQKAFVSAVFNAGMQASFSGRYFMNWQGSVLFGLTDMTSSDNGDYKNLFGDKTGYKSSTAFKVALRIGIGMRLE